MRVLLVISRPLEINTSSSIRNRATIAGLLKLGYEVELLTTQFDEHHNNFDPNLKIEGLYTNYIELSGIHKVANFSRKFRMLNFFRKKTKRIMSKLDVYDNLKTFSNHS